MAFRFNLGVYGIKCSMSSYELLNIYIIVPIKSELFNKDGKEMIIDILYDESINKEEFREFVNSNCNFFYKKEGEFTKEKSDEFVTSFRANIENEIKIIKEILNYIDGTI